MLVRQSFPLHGKGEMKHLQDLSLFKELSRVVTSQGTVVRYMRDGSTEVQYTHTNTHTLVKVTHTCTFTMDLRADSTGSCENMKIVLVAAYSHTKLSLFRVSTIGAVCRWLSQFQQGLWSRVGA